MGKSFELVEFYAASGTVAKWVQDQLIDQTWNNIQAFKTIVVHLET
jgi:hypothetical protein